MTEEIKQRIETIKAGKVPVGYKKTQFGVFPDDWVTDKTLGDIFLFYGGLGISREQLGSKGIAYLHYGDMHKGTFKKVAYEQYSLLPKYDIQLDGNETFLMKDGDVVFLDASEDLEGTSRSVLVDNPDNNFFIAGLHTTLGKSKDDFLDKWYKQYITTTDAVKKQFQELAVGFKVYGVNRKEITKIIIPCPRKKDEQNRIAEILSKWDRAIELQEKMIEKLELQKKALMQKLLTPKEGWKKVKLGELAFMQSGGTPKSTVEEYYNGNIIWVSINDISSCGKYLSNSERKITEKGLKNSSARLFPKGTILYAMYASIGKCCIATAECSTSQAILGIMTNEKLVSEYLYYFLLHHQERILAQGQKGTQSNLNKEMVQNIIVDLPETIDKQISLVKILNCFDRYIDSHIEKLATLKRQQKSIQQLLLTGIVRV